MRKPVGLSVIEQALLKVDAEDSPLRRRILKSMVRVNKSRSATPDKGWDANLSYRTYTQLVRKGDLQQ